MRESYCALLDRIAWQYGEQSSSEMIDKLVDDGKTGNGDLNHAWMKVRALCEETDRKKRLTDRDLLICFIEKRRAFVGQMEYASHNVMSSYDNAAYDNAYDAWMKARASYICRCKGYGIEIEKLVTLIDAMLPYCKDDFEISKMLVQMQAAKEAH